MNKKPLYGIISYTGGQYTVVYKKNTRNQGCVTTGSLSGYGKFPFSDYPNLPIIDYTGNEAVFSVLSWNLIIRESSNIGPYTDSKKVVSLDDFLNRVYNAGIMIYNLPDHIVKES